LFVSRAADSLPTDLASALALIITQREALAVAEAKAAAAESVAKLQEFAAART